MRSTRKKVIKTVYKDEDSEEEGDDFSDAGSEAKFSEESSSDEEIECVPSSGDEFDQKTKKARPPRQTKNIKSMGVKKPFVKNLVSKINKQMSAGSESENVDVSPALFSVKDLTESDKLLPSILNLSESDSSDDDNELPNAPNTSNLSSRSIPTQNEDSDSDNDTKTEYKDVWSHNIQENSEEIAKKTFMELEQHKSQIEETKASLQNYTMKIKAEQESSDVKDLLALGEEALPEETAAVIKKIKARKRKNESDSEMEDWEEVKESKAIPQQGLQLFVEFPEAGCRKSKKLDVEMMMKRKINRVKKEYQVYMHKVHVLCWLGHGNYINRVLNDQEIMSIVLSLVPSKECYPGERVDMKYVEQITTWFKDKLTLKQDKNEDKFKPKAPPLKTILLEQIKKKVVTSKKYLVFIFVAMLRALGLQCRVMFNFVTVPIKPPSSELCSLSTKAKAEKESHHDTKKADSDTKEANKVGKSKAKSKCKKETMPQLDGHFDFSSDDQKIMQLDGSDDKISGENRTTRSKRKKPDDTSAKKLDEDISPPKLAKKGSGRKTPSLKQDNITNEEESKNTQKRRNTKATENKKEIVQKNVSKSNTSAKGNISEKSDDEVSPPKILKKGLGRASPIQRSTRGKATVKPKKESSNANSAAINSDNKPNTSQGITLKVIKSQTININPATVTTLSAESSTIDSKKLTSDNNSTVPNISITDENQKDISSKYFNDSKASKGRLSRTRSKTNNPTSEINKEDKKDNNRKTRNKSAPAKDEEKSKYFNNNKTKENTPKKGKASEDSLRVSHRDLAKNRPKANNDVTGDLIGIVKKRIKEAKDETKKGLVKGKIKKESDEDSDYLPEVDAKRRSGSEDDFKPCKISPRPSTSRKIDRRVLSSTDEEPVKKNKIDVWCEIFVEELEQWISVDVIKGKVHSTGDLYNNATHPVCYTVGWDNSNHLKDLTRKYVPHWNTVTRKLRAEPVWWDKAVKPWLGPKTAREREEDEYLDKMQLEAPLPKSIAEYKNHPLYALKRHLLKFEAIYPPDAAVLGFVRNEPVYARECVYTCRSRDTWLKEAKVVKLGENPYKVVKARPKWDKLSNKVITDKPLEVFGPWQVQEYEPPVAENGIVPRNAYGNVELFKECMLPKGTVHIKLPGLNRVAKKLNIDCAPAMTGFDFNGGWSHPVYDGFVVCKEFEEIITEAWMKDQEEQERRELEKMEARVYGNWKRLIKGLMIRERLKDKYGFEEPPPEQSKSKNKGPRLVVKKKS